MSRAMIGLIGVMVFVSAGAIWGSLAGWGFAQPPTRPLSIREKSARGSSGGGHWFLWGGGSSSYGK